LIKVRHYLFPVIAFICLGTGVVFFHASCRSEKWHETAGENQRIAAILGLSDMVLSTEGRYLRHPSQSDLFSAFQDTPSGFDLFPSAAFVSPPQHVGKTGMNQQANTP
jgi:hypothetical protein